VPTVFATPWFSIEEMDAGMAAPFHRVVGPDGVMCMVLTEAGEVVLVRQFRPAIQAVTLEFPAGGLEAGETPDQAMAREILEETGYRCRTLVRLGGGCLSPNRLSNHETFFLGTGARPVPDHRPESGAEVVVMTRPALRDLILEDEFVQSAALVIVGLAEIRLGCRLFEDTVERIEARVRP